MDRRLIILSVGMFALGTDSFVMAGVLPQIASGLHVTIPAAGQLTSAYAIAFALLAPVLAAVTAHVPRKTMLLTSLAIFVVANLWTATATSLSMALLSRVLAGLGAALYSPTAAGTAATLVAPERRGRALAIVIAGMTVSTAIGAPIGTFIGGFVDWRWTMVFVAALAVLSAGGVAIFLSRIPMLPAIPLAKRLAPIADPRVGLTLLTTMLFFCAAFVVYTYFSVVFAPAIGGSTTRFGLMLVLWGAAGTVANLRAGRLLDAIGSRRVLAVMLVLVILDFALLPWTATHLATAVVAIAVWGACGWGILVPQQHRLVGIAPAVAPLLLGLNSSATYLGTTFAGLVGAVALRQLGPQALGWVAAAFAVAALVCAELSAARIEAGGGALAGRLDADARPGVPELEVAVGYRPGLVGRIVEMHAEFYARHWQFGAFFERRVAADLAEFVSRIDRPANRIWLALQDDRIVGSVAIDGEDLGGNQAHLRWFILDEGCRGGGVGRRLMVEAVAFCDQAGYEAIQLFTFKGLDAARRLYESFGFTLTSEEVGDQWGSVMTEQQFTRQR
ncbi:MFS transporter [Bacillus sp. NP157]|nr:MFS transporter [Bacillus sp. NP157]